jgi:Arrestin (or S-antigen), C-terminal domain
MSVFNDVVFEKPFSVVRTENLINFPWTARPVETEDEHMVMAGCCETLPFFLSFKTERTGYALGETIHIVVLAHNQGALRFQQCVLSLDRVETCFSQKPVKDSIKSRKVITYVNLKNLEPYESCKFEETLNIPKELAIVTSEKQCEVVKIAYEIKFSAKTVQKYTVEDFLPITIATVGELESIQEEGHQLEVNSKKTSVAGSSESVHELSKLITYFIMI